MRSRTVSSSERLEDATMKRILLVVTLIAMNGLALVAQGTGYTAADFKANRDKLMALAGNGIIVLPPGHAEVPYLTGLTGREVGLILVPAAIARRAPDPEVWKSTIYLPNQSPRAGVWEDRAVAYGDDVRTETGIDNTAPSSRFVGDLAKLGAITDVVYLPYQSAPVSDGPLPADLKLVDDLRRMLPSVTIKSLSPALDTLHWAKTPTEIALMRKACDITTEAYKEAARAIKVGLRELDVDGVINYVFKRTGAERATFVIVGTGPNSVILHHGATERAIQAGDLVLLDIGAGYRRVSTDLTRTVPASGTFTSEQRKIYEIVLDANKKATAVSKPGATLADVHRAAWEVIDKAGYSKYFMHGTSHPLNGGVDRTPLSNGLSMPSKYSNGYSLRDVPLVPGSMFTIEPGIYLPDKGFGIRIEDDILITETGYEVLTKSAPKEVAEIEALMKEPTAFVIKK
jgi:Xaa-Pro aminopeptidase